MYVPLLLLIKARKSAKKHEKARKSAQKLLNAQKCSNRSLSSCWLSVCILDIGDPFTYWVKPLCQEQNYQKPKLLARSVI
jgi:hypothetical protein